MPCPQTDHRPTSQTDRAHTAARRRFLSTARAGTASTGHLDQRSAGTCRAGRLHTCGGTFRAQVRATNTVPNCNQRKTTVVLWHDAPAAQSQTWFFLLSRRLHRGALAARVMARPLSLRSWRLHWRRMMRCPRVPSALWDTPYRQPRHLFSSIGRWHNACTIPNLSPPLASARGGTSCIQAGIQACSRIEQSGRGRI